MNPAVDIFATTERLIDDGKSRCRNPRREPGGGGINVARNLHRFGADVLAVYAAGGLNGQMLEQVLQRDKIPSRCVHIEDETRQNLAITERSSDKMYHLVFPGPELKESEWQECVDVISSLEPAPGYLVLSGSMPAGVPDDFYGRLARAASQRDIKVVLDTSGAALRAAQKAGIYLAKLNRGEFAELGYTNSTDRQELLAAMGQAVDDGFAEVLIVTLDADGALLASRSGDRLHIRPPRTPVVSHVGAGDGFLSVLVYQLHRGNTLQEAFRYGVAAAAAKVQTHGNQLEDMDLLERIYNEIKQTDSLNTDYQQNAERV